MHPALSIGGYLLLQVLIFFLVKKCLGIGILHKKAHVLFIILTIIYAVAVLLPVAGALLPDSDFKFAAQAGGNTWLGFDLYFSGIFLILFILSGILPGRKETVRQGIVIFSAAAALVIFSYGMIHAQDTVVTRYDVDIQKNAGDVRELKIVLIADLHLSVNSHLKTTEKMVDLINAEDPDAVLVAGDIFTSSYAALKNPDAYSAALKKISSKYGVYAVYGNHDVEETLFGGFPISPISRAFRTAEMEKFFDDSGFQILYDETCTIADGLIQITGRVDGEKAGDGTADRKTPSEVLADVDQGKPVIVLQHEPVEFSLLKESGADLALCGHTHAGQIFPGNLIVPFFNENAYGYCVVSGLDTIVTSGVGYYGPPMRVGTDSEIAVITLHFN